MERIPLHTDLNPLRADVIRLYHLLPRALHGAENLLPTHLR